MLLTVGNRIKIPGGNELNKILTCPIILSSLSGHNLSDGRSTNKLCFPFLQHMVKHWFVDLCWGKGLTLV